MTGGGTDTTGGRVITRNRPSRGGVEGSGVDSKFPLHSLHCLPRRPPYFWAGRVTGTDYLKTKLHQQLTTMIEEVLYAIFMDLYKAYDDLERDR